MIQKCYYPIPVSQYFSMFLCTNEDDSCSRLLLDRTVSFFVTRFPSQYIQLCSGFKKNNLPLCFFEHDFYKISSQDIPHIIVSAAIITPPTPVGPLLFALSQQKGSEGGGGGVIIAALTILILQIWSTRYTFFCGLQQTFFLKKMIGQSNNFC